MFINGEHVHRTEGIKDHSIFEDFKDHCEMLGARRGQQDPEPTGPHPS